jgi:amino acid transporter
MSTVVPDPRSLGSVRPTLRGRDVIAVTVGIVIGAGIFRVPALIAAMAPNEASVLIVWLAGGLLSIVGALCYAELASAYPNVGGDLHFLERAYGSRLAFLYGWGRMTVIQTGSIALLAYVFGDYLAALLPVGPYSSALYAAAAILALSFANWAGVRLGTNVQFWLTMLEVAGLVLLILSAFLLIPASGPGAEPARPDKGNWGLMMVFVLLTYGGWNEASYLSAEITNVGRRIAPLLIASLAMVTLLYLLTNLALLRALGLSGLAKSPAVGVDIMQKAAGAPGAALIGLAVAVAALTSANATAMTGARSSCAVGRSFAALRWLGRWDEKRRTPANAMLAQAVIALVLVGAGALGRDGFRQAVEFTAPVFWFFFLLVGLSLFILRVRESDHERPFRAPLYPLLPAIFCATSLYLLYSSLAEIGAGALAGVGVLAAGALMLPFLRPVAPSEADM